MTDRSVPPLLDQQGRPETRQKILDAAAALFARNGASATSMRDIAKACEINAGSIYYYFQSKDDILQEILDLGIVCIAESVSAALKEAGEGASFEVRFRAAIQAHLSSFFTYGDYTATHLRVFKQAPSEIQARNIPLRDRYEGIWDDLLVQGVNEGTLARDIDLNAARLLLLGAMNWTIEWFAPGKNLAISEIGDLVLRIFLDGCRVRSRRR